MTKRKGSGRGEDTDVPTQSAKRPRNGDVSHHQSPSSKTRKSASSFTEQPRQDPTYGQRGAFPGLYDEISISAKRGSGNDEEDEIGVAAMAYLREVR